MIYVLIAIMILIMIAIFLSTGKLGQLLYATKAISDKVAELNIDVKDINEVVSEYQKIKTHEKEEKKKEEKKKEVKKIDVNYASKSYMTNMYGYIEQTKLFNIQHILGEIEKIPYKDNIDFIKRYYLLMFARMMEDNNLQFSDFKIGHTYGGAGPSEYHYINFELKDPKYYGWDEWVSKAKLIIKMDNGEKKEFEVESYMNNLENYFETESEYESVHFFDALAKVYGKFSFVDESYSSSGGYSDDKYTLVINDLVQQYSRVGKKWNVYFANSRIAFDDGPWWGELDDVFTDTGIIDPSWAIDKFQEVQILEWEEIRKKREETYQSLLQSKDEDEKFRLATMYYYEQFDTNWNIEEGTYQQKAIKIWKELAENGHAYSQLVIGILYFDGLYLLKNFSKTKEYIELAFDNGLEKPAKKVWEDLKLYNY